MSNARFVVRIGGLAVLTTLAACADGSAVAPFNPPSSASQAAAAGGDEGTTVSPGLDGLNAQLAAVNSNVRIAKVELRVNSDFPAATSTIVLASSRFRGLGFEWVKGDPRRGGRLGVTYQDASARATLPFVINPDRATARLATAGELSQQIEEGIDTWRELTCSDVGITRVPIPANTDPDALDNLFRLQPISGNYQQTADIIESGWHPRQFFRNVAQLLLGNAALGDNIIGFAPSLVFADANDNLTDIDRNGKADQALAEVFYNARFVWDNSGIFDPRVVDFYSIIAHETGHALGLAHFGKVFVTKRDSQDGITVADVKYAPRALMNAIYVAGRDPVDGTDNSSFCQIWAKW